MDATRRLVGAAVLFAIVFLMLLLGGKPNNFIDLPSVIFIFAAIFGGILISFSFSQIFDACNAALQGPSAPCVSAWQRKTRAAVFTRLHALAWGSGIIATIIGFIMMLSDLSDPYGMGPGLAVSLLTILYGAALAELLFAPMRQSVLNQPPLDDDTDTDTAVGPSSPGEHNLQWKGVAVIALMMGAMGLVAFNFFQIPELSQGTEVETSIGLPDTSIVRIDH